MYSGEVCVGGIKGNKVRLGRYMYSGEMCVCVRGGGEWVR